MKTLKLIILVATLFIINGCAIYNQYQIRHTYAKTISEKACLNMCDDDVVKVKNESAVFYCYCSDKTQYGPILVDNYKDLVFKKKTIYRGIYILKRK